MVACNSKWKYEILAVVVHVPYRTQNLVISRCCFAEDAKKFIKICNARTQPSPLLITLFVDVAVAVVVSSGSLKPPSVLLTTTRSKEGHAAKFRGVLLK